MHPLISGRFFAVVAAPLLLSVLAFNFLNKKKASVRKDVEDVDTGGSGSLTAPMGSNSGESSSSPTEKSYDVFLSFRGLDTRYDFTDHLYNGFDFAGIHAFRDNEELRQGEEIGSDLLAAIKNSKILIPILSENYGTSRWCLDELVQIMERKKNNPETTVLPIFYKVAPADVQHQIGKFGEAFRERERRWLARGFDSTILNKWKQALEEVGHLKGREVNGSEAELVKSVVEQVLLKLKKKFEFVIPKNLVGIDSHVQKIMKFVDDNSSATVFVGFHGMGGIGKTTLAKTIYNELSYQFEYRSFIADIRESCEHNGIECLQNQLISDILMVDHEVSNRDEGIRLMSYHFRKKKVLILLDDVNDQDHLKFLTGSHDWFSSGSVIIITTRNKCVLDNAEVDYNYEISEMDEETSLILFSRHAFGKDAPPSEFKVLAHDVVSTTGGLPLSLEVLGSFLHGKPQRVWKDTIKKFRNTPPPVVQKQLRTSYDALDYESQQIFLDIACFFIGTDLRIASYMWDACDFYPEWGIEVLRSMSLIKVGENYELQMHDQLRDLGWEIVRQEGKREPWKCSRLWDSKEVLKVLKEDKGTEKIEAICLGGDSSVEEGDNILTGEQFKNLRNLRFLNVRGVHFSGDFKNSLMKLKWLQWKNCPSAFGADNFHVDELQVLNLCGSEISDQWQGWSWIKVAKELKCLDLTNCESLQKTSFLSAFDKLEVLILTGCIKIEQIDSSIGNMKRLVRLDLMRCVSLEGLPAEVGKLEALEQLSLHGCPNVSSLPAGIWALWKLQILDVSGTGIKELPNCIGGLGKLRELDASGCEELGGEVPESIGKLSSLQRLNLYGCKKLQSVSVFPSNLTFLGVTCSSRILPSLSNLTHLKELHLDCQYLKCIRECPSTQLEILEINGSKLMEILDASQFTHLRTLTAQRCTDLRKIQGLCELRYLESLEVSFCESIGELDLPKSKGLKKLKVHDCKNLVKIQGLHRLESLRWIDISGCASIERLDLSNPENLFMLYAKDCEHLVEIQGLDGLKSLEEIDISGCASIQRLDLSETKGLKKLSVGSCKKLSEIHGLDGLKFLKVLNMSGCTSFGRLPNICCFDTLHKLAINCCDNVHDIGSLERFPSCTTLWIEDCNSLANFPNLSNFHNLEKFFLTNCHELREIPGLGESMSLVHIAISRCSSIEILPDFSSCTNLTSLVVQNCEQLTELRGLEKLDHLRRLDISGCKSLKTIPELSGIQLYRNYEENPFDSCRLRIEFGEDPHILGKAHKAGNPGVHVSVHHAIK